MGFLQPRGGAGGGSCCGAGAGEGTRRRPDIRPRHDEILFAPGMGARRRFRHRGRSPGAGDLHADQRLRPGVSRLRCQAEARLRGGLMADRSFLSWPFLEQRHQELHDRVEAWAVANIARLSVDDDTSAAAAATVRLLVIEMGKAGILATAVGGRDGSLRGPLDARSLCICREVLARHAGLADFSFAMQGLGTGPISLFGTDEQKERWLPSVARGTTISAFALSEREAGSDVSALAMRAQPDGNQCRLDGAKTWISNAGIADLYVVFARTGETPGAKGLSAFVVEADTPGFSVAKVIDLIAAHSTSTE